VPLRQRRQQIIEELGLQPGNLRMIERMRAADWL